LQWEAEDCSTACCKSFLYVRLICVHPLLLFVFLLLPFLFLFSSLIEYSSDASIFLCWKASFSLWVFELDVCL
jgi:hypothetical protein